jgi:hypothetical protein
MFKCISDLCHCLAVLHVRRFRKDFLDKIYITDMKKYKFLKRDEASLQQDKHLPRLYPEATVVTLLDALDSSLSTLLPSIADGGCRSDVIGYCTILLICELAEMVLSGGDDRYYTAADSALLLGDVDEIVEYFSSTSPPENRKMQAEVDRLAEGLRSLLSKLFALPSDTLVEQGRGWPDDPKLDDFRSKYVVKCILQHRKDKSAKKYVGFDLWNKL